MSLTLRVLLFVMIVGGAGERPSIYRFGLTDDDGVRHTLGLVCP